ncbi:MAG: 16S rRNA (cytosine(1402)-N(4))-methyltransferase RsmH [Planctomycetes bacterium]|nr:16S rRNA (cytosine(1402)-N(4))-methyltransferase RsmH [Planctomycetota bacterium]
MPPTPPADRPVHVPVLLDAVLERVAPRPGDRCCDATLGAGGYARRLLAACRPSGSLLVCDRDPSACDAARAGDLGVAPDCEIWCGNFAALADHRSAADGFDALVADLGVSSAHVDDPARGFSFLRDGPLDMRMDPRSGRSAADFVARESEDALADLFYELGEEHRSRRVARAIVAARGRSPIETTGALAGIVSRALGGRRGARHPATRVFQALRCAVNREIENLDAFLAALPRLVRPGGRAAVVTYHSLEDRRVKRAFLALERGAAWTVLTRKPVVADLAERRANPRSRSAKLRAILRSEAPNGPGAST